MTKLKKAYRTQIIAPLHHCPLGLIKVKSLLPSLWVGWRIYHVSSNWTERGIYACTPKGLQ